MPSLPFEHGEPAGYKDAHFDVVDAFATFREKRIFSRDIGERFRHEILERGDSEDPAVLYQRFADRDARPEPLFERSGLTT